MNEVNSNRDKPSRGIGSDEKEHKDMCNRHKNCPNLTLGIERLSIGVSGEKNFEKYKRRVELKAEKRMI